MTLRTVFAVILALSFTAGAGAVDEPDVATLKIGASVMQLSPRAVADVHTRRIATVA